MKAQSRFMLVAVIGMWIGFLGLMAIVVGNDAFPKMLGAAALICGLMIALFGLGKVVRDRPGLWIDQRP